MVNFWPIPESWHVSPPSEPPRDTNNKNHPSIFSQSIICYARDRSSSRGIDCPEDTLPSKNIAVETSSSVLSRTATATNSIDFSYIYGVRYAARSSHVSHIIMTLTPARIVIAPAIKGRIPAVTRESQRANHAVIENRITRTANEGSPGIYIHWGKIKNKEKLRLSFYYREETSPNY